MTKKARNSIIMLVLFGLGLGLPWWDTAPYRAAREELGNVAAKDLAEVEAQTKVDIGLWQACLELREKSQDGMRAVLTPQWRTCVMEGMPKATTFVGAISFGASAIAWLDENPHDEEVRTAAVSLVDRAREDVLKTKPKYDLMERAAEAHDQSVLLRMRDGRENTGSLYVKLLEKLNDLEYSIMLPAVFHKQEQFMARAIVK